MAKPLIKPLAYLSAIALVVTACGGDDDASSDEDAASTDPPATTDSGNGGDATDSDDGADATDSTDGEATDETDETEENAESETDGGIVGEGATLRANWGGFPENWVPGADFADGYFRVPYETLITYDENGELVGQLATEWAQTDEALTLTLREGVVFHDGEPFNAEAVKTSIEATLDSGSRLAGGLGAISSIDVVDEYTVQLNTDSPAPGLTQTLTRNSGFMHSPAAIEAGTLVDQPVGTGPWAYNADASSVGTRLNFEFFPDYWGGRESVGFDTIELYAIEDDNAATGALETGQIDLTDSEAIFFEQLDANDTLDYLLYPAVRNAVHFFDRGPDGVFGDVNLRRAVCSAMDTNVLSQLEPDLAGAAQHFEEGQVGYAADLAPYGGDLDAANGYLAEAGNPEVSAEYLATFFNETQITVYVDQMNELDGVNLSVQTVPPPQFFSSWNTGEYPLGTGSQNEDHPHPWYLSWYAADAPNNPSGYESAELKAAADAAIAAGTSAEADDLWAEVVRIVEEEALSCSRAISQEILAWNSDTITNVAPTTTPWVTQTVNYRALRPTG